MQQFFLIKKIIQNLNDSRDKLNGDSFKIVDKSNWLKTLDDILGEKGVKQMAIKTILPSLNSEIINLMRDMNLDYQVVFDDKELKLKDEAVLSVESGSELLLTDGKLKLDGVETELYVSSAKLQTKKKIRII